MPITELLDITKDYYQPATGIPTRVLDHISLAVAKEDSIAIMGPSGSGKTTLLNILGTLDQPTSGTVVLDRKHVEQLDEKQLADIRNRFVGFIFQQHFLLPQLSII